MERRTFSRVGGTDQDKWETSRFAYLRQWAFPAPCGMVPQGFGKLHSDVNKAVLEELAVAYGQHRIV